MRRITCWAITASLGVALFWATAEGLARDTYQSGQPKKKSMWQLSWPEWPFKKKPAKKTKAEQIKEEVRSKYKAGKRRVSADNPESSPLAQEQAELIRRQQVCDKLTEIAHASNDAALEAQAKTLEQRAWFLYDKRAEQAKQLASIGGRPPAGDEAELVKAAEAEKQPVGKKPKRGIFDALTFAKTQKEE